MQRILVMGLPGAGKTYLARQLSNRLTQANKHVEWLNADDVRKKYNDWDFSTEGRIRQSLRMRELADSMTSADYVICDFVAPLSEMRENFNADWTIWIDTIDAGRYEDTNQMFVPPSSYDFRITEQNSERWSKFIFTHIYNNHCRPVFDCRKKTLYLDIDGVVADFDAFAEVVCGFKVSEDRWPDDAWDKIKINPRFYMELEKTKEGDQLVEYCKKFAIKHNYNLMFLTAIPKSNDVPWAFYDKMYWINKHYGAIPVMFGPYSKDKYHHCKPGDILIDDRQSNIDEWKEAKGVGILHKGNLDDTINQLDKLKENK